MAQAKTLNQSEIDMVLRYISTKQKYSIRNRAMLLTSCWSGMRVGEIAALRICDVLNEDGTIKSEIRLSASQTVVSPVKPTFLKCCFLPLLDTL